jgi:hypothetical protein
MTARLGRLLECSLLTGNNYLAYGWLVIMCVEIPKLARV